MVIYKSVLLSRIVGYIACLYRQYHHEGGSCGQEVNTSNSRSGGLEGTLTLEFPSKKEQRFAKFNQKSIKRLASTLLSGIQARDKVLQKGIPHLLVFSLWLFSADNGWVWLFLAHKRHSCYKPLNSSHPQS